MLRHLAAAFSDGEIEISGDATGLAALATFLAGNKHELDLEQAAASKFYPNGVRYLRKVVTSSAIRFHPSGDTLLIEGCSEKLRVLAESVQSLVSGSHVHFAPGANPIIDGSGQWELVVIAS